MVCAISVTSVTKLRYHVKSERHSAWGIRAVSTQCLFSPTALEPQSTSAHSPSESSPAACTEKVHKVCATVGTHSAGELTWIRVRRTLTQPPCSHVFGQPHPDLSLSLAPSLKFSRSLTSQRKRHRWKGQSPRASLARLQVLRRARRQGLAFPPPRRLRRATSASRPSRR